MGTVWVLVSSLNTENPKWTLIEFRVWRRWGGAEEYHGIEKHGYFSFHIGFSGFVDWGKFPERDRLLVEGKVGYRI